MRSSSKAKSVPSIRVPERGDVVSCRFPLVEAPTLPGEKARPCLVLGVHQPAEGPMMVEIAYGTAAGTRSNIGFHFDVETDADRRAAGVHRVTRFVLARVVLVPLASPWLAANAAGSATLGRLPGHLRLCMESLDAARRQAVRHNRLVAINQSRRSIMRPVAAAPGSEPEKRGLATSKELCGGKRGALA